MQVRIAVLQVLYTLALALWLGGLVVLGAIVAPTVFAMVPMPASADAMTVAFRRFDAVAVGSALTALGAEAGLVRWGGKTSRIDVVRTVTVTVAAALAVVEAAWLTPRIAALHRGGAIRGLGESGRMLESFHRAAETVGKAQLTLLLLLLVLLVVQRLGLWRRA
jgi:hypothetical protein